MTQENEPKVENTPEIASAASIAENSGPIGAAISASEPLADGEQLAPAKTTIVEPF
jgi:hypothetical protein